MLQVKTRAHSQPGRVGTRNTRTDSALQTWAGTPELHLLGCPRTARDAAGQDWWAPGSTDLLKSKDGVRTEAQTGGAKASLQAPSCTTPASQTPWVPCFCENQELWHSIRKMSLKLLIKGNFLSHPFSLATLKHSSNDPATSRQNVSLLTKNLYISTAYCSNHKKLH